MPDQNDIASETARFAEAQVYRLDNAYLDAAEKQEVELWFQLPIHFGLLAFLISSVYSIYHPLPWYLLVAIPVAANLISGAILWAHYNRRAVFACYIVFAHSWTLNLLILVAAVWLFVTGHVILGILALFAKYVSILFGWHIMLYSILSLRHKMNAKFVFFKKFYGRSFPFECITPQ